MIKIELIIINKLEFVKEISKLLPWNTEVVVCINNMAQLMVNSDLCIGAAGATSWERCCLGLPSLILVCIAIPSFALLYSMDEIVDPAVTVKAIGHQWYWSYEYSDYNQTDQPAVAFDSYMVPEDDLSPGQLRLLEVDNRVVVPVNTHLRFIITAADVLHSWAIPSLGIKCDAVPGRLNQVPAFIKREGVFYGQCSEICGVNHGFMPIAVEAVALPKYIEWVKEKLAEA